MEATGQSITYQGPNGLILHLENTVLKHLDANAQRRCFSREAGGQLFASIRNNRWILSQATGPRSSDYRSRFLFRPDRKAERAEILAFFEQGLHYVGDWHTHPQDIPSPSNTDFRNITETVQASEHSLPGFVMVIVGRSPAPEGLWLSFHDVRGGYSKCTLHRDRLIDDQIDRRGIQT